MGKILMYNIFYTLKDGTEGMTLIYGENKEEIVKKSEAERERIGWITAWSERIR